MVLIKEWLDQNYPKVGRNKVKEINAGSEKLEGHGDLTDFINLERLILWDNQLSSLDLSNSTKLTEIDCRRNQLVDLNLPHSLPDLTTFNCSNNLLTDLSFLKSFNPKKIARVGLGSNNFSYHDLTCFSHLIELELLFIGNDDQLRKVENIYNRFHGSLTPLKNLTNLKALNVDNTNIDSGLEYLPVSLERIYCQFDYQSNSQIKIRMALEPYKKEEQFEYCDYLSWRKDNLDLINQIRENDSILTLITIINSALTRDHQYIDKLTNKEMVLQVLFNYLEEKVKGIQKKLYKKNEFEAQIEVLTERISLGN